MSNLLIVLVLFIVLVGALMLVVQVILRRRQAAQRMHMRLMELQAHDDVELTQILSRQSQTSPSWWHDYGRRLYRQAGVQWSLGQWLLRLMGGFIMAFGLLSLVSMDWLSCLLLSLILTLVGLWGWLMRQRRLRQKAFVLALPEAIGIIVRSLQAGHPLPEGLRTVADELSGVISAEFASMNDQVSLGAPAEVALLRMYDHVGAEEIRLMAITVSVQAGTGGNLAEVLGKLADLIRQRSMLHMKIKAISAEGRFSAMVMAVFPFLLFGLLTLLSPGYFDVVWQSGYGWHMVMVALGLIGVGVAWLVRLVDMDM